MARFYLEHCVTLYHADVFEADSYEEALRMRDNTTWEYDRHLDEAFLGRKVTEGDLQRSDYVDMVEVDWDYDGPVMSREEFINKYTSLEV